MIIKGWNESSVVSKFQMFIIVGLISVVWWLVISNNHLDKKLKEQVYKTDLKQHQAKQDTIFIEKKNYRRKAKNSIKRIDKQLKKHEAKINNSNVLDSELEHFVAKYERKALGK